MESGVKITYKFYRNERVKRKLMKDWGYNKSSVIHRISQRFLEEVYHDVSEVKSVFLSVRVNLCCISSCAQYHGHLSNTRGGGNGR